MSYPIKVQELCEKCKYGFNNQCSVPGCRGCPQYDSKAGYGKSCLCLTVKKGEPCNMYEEAEGSGDE